MSAIARTPRRAFDDLSAFELRLSLRGRAALAGALAYGAAVGAVALVGLSAFRQVGLGALTPASTGLLEIGLLVPTLVALVCGGIALHGDREDALRAMLRASGVPAHTIVLAKLVGLIALSAIVVLTGTAVAALVLAGALRASDVAILVYLLVIILLATVASASIGLLVSALARDRSHALIASLAVWSALAIGIDVAILALAPALRAGGPLLALAAAIDPLEAARIAGLLALGADAHVLGSLGASLAATAGAPRALLGLLGALVLWTVVPTAAACLVVARREAR